MAPQAGETLKDFLISYLSPDDQVVVKTILHTILNKDRMTCNRLADIVHGATHENDYSKNCEFTAVTSHTSSSNLHCPMAIRLSRLQQELQWLHSDMLTESDKNALLGQKLDDLYGKVKSMEEKNNELTQRLKDSQAQDTSNQPDTSTLAMKRQLKRLQSDYEAMSQKYCDLNIAHEHLLKQQEKDRKQIRHLQLELNDETERFQCEITDLQMKLDAARAENFDLERILKEQKHWIEVLEDNQNQNISPKNQNSTPEFTNSFGNDTPPREEHENIGFTLLSLEVEKLQGELAAQRLEMNSERQRFQTEKEYFLLQEQALKQEIGKLNFQSAEMLRTNQSLQHQLDQAHMRIQDITDHCRLLQQEKVQLTASLDALRSELQTELNRQTELTRREIGMQGLNMELELEDDCSLKLEPARKLDLTKKRLLQMDSDPLQFLKPAALRSRSLPLTCADDSLSAQESVQELATRSELKPHRQKAPSCWTFPCSRLLLRSYRGARGRSRATQRARTRAKGKSGDGSIPIRRRPLKPGRNGLAARQLHYQILRAPSLTLDDGNDTLKVPRGAGRFFTCDDEESEMLSSSYLTEVAEGRFRPEDLSMRLSECSQHDTYGLSHKPLCEATDVYDPRGPVSFVSSSRHLQQESICDQTLPLPNIDMTPILKIRRNATWDKNLEVETPMQPIKRRPFVTPRILCTPSACSPPTPEFRRLSRENSSPPTYRDSVRLTPASIIKKVQSKMRITSQNAVINSLTPRVVFRSFNIFSKHLSQRGYDSQV